MDKKSVLIFGVGELQLSIINRANDMGLFTVGIDPCEEACAKDACAAFEVVDGQNFEGTVAVAKNYKVSAVVTAATDKPLVMMARVAKELNFTFLFSRNRRMVNRQVSDEEPLPRRRCTLRSGSLDS